MKSRLRKELIKRREMLDGKVTLSREIADSFLSTDLYKNADTLLLYYSVGSEVLTQEIFLHALNDDKKVAFPVCRDKNGSMDFYYVTDEAQLQDGMYKIKAPIKICRKYSFSDAGLCIVPGLSFDKSGNRIGYGRGYYDRFLEKFNGISVGLCFEAMLTDKLPTESTDKKVNYLITDKKIYKFN